MWTPSITILILSELIIFCQVIDSKDLYILESKTSFNPNYMTNYYLSINPDHLSVNITFDIAKTFEQDPWMELEIKMRRGKGRVLQRLLKYDVNLCKVLTKGQSKILDSWVENFFTAGTLPRSCPFKKGIYSWPKMRLDTSNIPQFVVIAKHETSINLYFKSKPRNQDILNTTLVFEWK
ncbi:uncharacterized protein LOC142235298 [Haematobia irritans]|uniref:uncharacterized protein LOC142235298 n=1 Tax=Haematobia irritans TaxID=7368 RepID=UPI003F4FB6C5